MTPAVCWDYCETGTESPVQTLQWCLESPPPPTQDDGEGDADGDCGIPQLCHVVPCHMVTTSLVPWYDHHITGPSTLITVYCSLPTTAAVSSPNAGSHRRAELDQAVLTRAKLLSLFVYFLKILVL